MSLQVFFKSLFLSLTVLLSTERVLLVLLIVWACRAPELPVCAPIWGAGVVGLSHEDEREHARLTVGVSTVRLVSGLCKINERKGRADGSYRIWLWNESGALKLISRRERQFFLPSLQALTPLLTADSVAQTGTEHLLVALASEPALSVIVGGSRVCAARPLNWRFGRLPSVGGGQHDGTCGCKKKYQKHNGRIMRLIMPGLWLLTRPEKV